MGRAVYTRTDSMLPVTATHHTRTATRVSGLLTRTSCKH